MAFLYMCSANGPTHIAIFKLFVDLLVSVYFGIETLEDILAFYNFNI